MRKAASARLLPAGARVPPRWRKEVERILITDRQLARRIRQTAREIERDFRGRETVVVSLLNGTVMFLADLIRHLSLPMRLDFIGVSSYGAGTESGDLIYTKELRLDVRGRDVLLVDDILDTGKTLSRVIPKLRALKPRRIKVCVLLDKPARRTEDVEADYIGFQDSGLFRRRLRLDFAERIATCPSWRAASAHLQAGVPAHQTKRKAARFRPAAPRVDLIFTRNARYQPVSIRISKT